MEKIKVRVNAKINLTLDVLGTYGAGYHELDSVMASVGIYDIVECEKAAEISVTMDGRVQGEGNTAYKAAKLCYENYGVGLCHIDITKGIPFAAGLGGSSADASATLYCIGRLYGLSYEQLYPIACKVGSDVAFIMNGGIMRASGKGDDLERLPYHDYCVVVAKGKQGTSTSKVFELYDSDPIHTTHTLDYINSTTEEGRLAAVGNGLQPAGVQCTPEVGRVIAKLSDYSQVVSMSGSGSSVYCIVDDMDYADHIADKFSKFFAYTKACKVLDYGIKEM